MLEKIKNFFMNKSALVWEIKYLKVKLLASEKEVDHWKEVSQHYHDQFHAAVEGLPDEQKIAFEQDVPDIH